MGKKLNRAIAITLIAIIGATSFYGVPSFAYSNEAENINISESPTSNESAIDTDDSTESAIETDSSTDSAINEDTPTESETNTEAVDETATDTSIEVQPLETTGDSIVVNNFKELKTAMEDGTNGITNFYLGGDITSEAGGILVSSTKDNIVLSGTNPNTGEKHIYTERASATKTDSIRLQANKTITLKDMTIDGKNYYGPATNNLDGTANVYIKYDNIDYDGPQISFNPAGTVHYKDSRITIPSTVKPGGSANQEVAEATNVILEGDVNIEKAYNGYSTFWMYTTYATEPTVTIQPGANVKINSGSYFIYSTNARLNIAEGGSLTANVYGGMTYLGQYMSRVNVEDGGTLKYNHLGTYGSLRTIIAKSHISVGTGATFDIRRTSASYSGSTDTYILLSMENANATISIDNPKKFLLINQGSNGTGLVRFSNGGTLSLETQAVNLWDKVPSLFAGNINGVDPLESWAEGDIPPYRWNQQKLYPFALTATYRSASPVNNPAISTTNGYTPATDSNTGTFTSSNFLNTSSKMISMGSQRLAFSDIYDVNDTIKGKTMGGAYVDVAYTDTEHNESGVDGFSSADGDFAFPLEKKAQAGTYVNGMSQHDFLRVYGSEEVLQDSGYLEFYSLPQQLSFPSINVPVDDVIIPRQDNGWAISIQDNRATSNKWQIYASAEKPLTASSEGRSYELLNALTYVTDEGQIPFTGTEQLIYDGETSSSAIDGITNVNWTANKGPLISISKGTDVKAGAEYSTTINWTLVDGPQ